jgi:hypothetical protein
MTVPFPITVVSVPKLYTLPSNSAFPYTSTVLSIVPIPPIVASVAPGRTRSEPKELEKFETVSSERPSDPTTVP